MDWKPISEIPGYEDFTNYELNIAGDLRNRKTGRIRKWHINSGYLRTIISQNGLPKDILKHVAICNLFKPNHDNKPYIDHFDRNPLNNSIDNLRWVTHTENMQNCSMRSNNTSGIPNIYQLFKHGKPVWEIRITSHSVRHYAYFPRNPNSDEIPKEVVDKRDEMKRKLHINTCS